MHRSLGVHVSKVRSCNLDTWLPEQVAFVSAMGNARANAFWEERLPADFRRPPENDMGQLRAYITDKYVARRYAARDYPEPPNSDNYAAHPVSGAGWEVGGGGLGGGWLGAASSGVPAACRCMQRGAGALP